jgi:hypothetical protein
LTASDFEVIALGWNPAPAAPSVASVGANPYQVVGGNSSVGTVTLTSAAPSGGALVSLSSANGAVSVPGSVSVGTGASSATFGITTSVVSTPTLTTISATYGGATKSTTFTVNPASAPALAALTLNRTTVVGGNPVIGTVTLAAPAPSGGATVTLASSNSSAASVPATVVVASGATSGTFTVATATAKKSVSVTLSAVYGGVTKTVAMKITRR